MNKENYYYTHVVANFFRVGRVFVRGSKITARAILAALYIQQSHCSTTTPPTTTSLTCFLFQPNSDVIILIFFTNDTALNDEIQTQDF